MVKTALCMIIAMKDFHKQIALLPVENILKMTLPLLAEIKQYYTILNMYSPTLLPFVFVPFLFLYDYTQSTCIV